MKIDFYFDPACPWCWITSRWILLAKNKRDIDVNWKLFSLAWKNGELDKESKKDWHISSHRVERVLIAAEKQGANLLDLYTNFGIRHFLSGDDYDDKLIAEILKQLKLDKGLIKYADDSSLDKDIIKSSKEALKAIGEDIGVPTIVFHEKGKSRGFFGPVLSELPTQEEAVKIWDSLVELSKIEYLSELKRGRSSGPDVYSTAKC
jgi:predicted DsbA family dithiol-disulfide isomerase